MRRSVVAGTIVGGAVLVAARARGPMKAHLVEGTLPGRSGSWVNSYLGRPMYRLMAEALEIGSEDDLLDVACGWGEFLVVYAPRARRVAGIDWSEEKVALARERLADRLASGTAEVVVGDATSMPWDDDTFTAATCMDAFPFFAAPERVLAEILRVLRPGGRMLMQIGMRWPDGPPKHMPHPTSHVVDVADEDSVRRLVRDAGFVDVGISYGPGSAGPFGHFVDLRLTGSDELRLVRGVKPQKAPGRK